MVVFLCLSSQKMARIMKLDMKTDQLWKDKALVELNAAVLHSYNVSLSCGHHVTYVVPLCSCYETIMWLSCDAVYSTPVPTSAVEMWSEYHGPS